MTQLIKHLESHTYTKAGEIKENLSFADVSKRFDVGLVSAVRWSKDIISQKTRNKPATKINMQALEKYIKPVLAYQYERVERLGVSKSGVWHALKRLKVTYKKTLKHPKAAPEKRSVFCQTIQHYQNEGRNYTVGFLS